MLNPSKYTAIAIDSSSDFIPVFCDIFRNSSNTVSLGVLIFFPWEIKNTAKTDEGNREIYIPDKLRDEILKTGVIYDGAPKVLLVSLHRFQDKLGIPRFRFHDLRHFYASYAHSMGMSDADIMKSGGWRSDFCMKNVYRHAMKDSLQANQKKIATGLL